MNWPPPNNGSGNGRPPDLDDIIKKVEDFFGKGGGGKALGALLPIALMLVAAIVAFLGFYTVDPEQVGVVRRFGEVVRVTEPGPHLKIPFVETVIKPEVTKVHRIEVGFQTIDSGPPARYTAVEEEALMLTGDENIVSVEFIVQFKILDAMDFLFNVRQQGATIKDAAEAAMREVIGANLIDTVLTEGRFEIQNQTRELLQRTLDRYDAGIVVTAVQLQDVLPPEQVSAAFKDVASAREDRARAVEQAEGYRNDIIPKAKGKAEEMINEAQGYKQARINAAEGDAANFREVLAAYRTAPTVTRKRLYLETMTEILDRTENIILDGPAGENTLPYLPLDRAPRRPAAGGNK